MISSTIYGLSTTSAMTRTSTSPKIGVRIVGVILERCLDVKTNGGTGDQYIAYRDPLIGKIVVGLYVSNVETLECALCLLNYKDFVWLPEVGHPEKGMVLIARTGAATDRHEHCLKLPTHLRPPQCDSERLKQAVARSSPGIPVGRECTVYDHGGARQFDLVVNTRITARPLKIGGKLYECIAVERT
jgi:hypothetical protein